MGDVLMHTRPLWGIGLVMLAGAFSGTALLPMKYTTQWKFENTWAVFSLCAYLIAPWMVALATVPEVFSIYAAVGGRVCCLVAIFGFGWGLAVVLNGVGVALVGLSLASAILMGSSVAVGSLAAFLLRDPRGIVTPAGVRIVSADAVMLLGVLLCALAGHWRGRGISDSNSVTSTSKDERRVTSAGIAVCLIAGLLSTLLNVALAYGDVITKAAILGGSNEFNAANAVWSLAVSAGSLPSLIWCAFALTRNKSWTCFKIDSGVICFVLCLSMALMWISGTVLYGASVNMLGPLGPAIGWPIYMSGIILVSSFWGWTTGEWRRARRHPIVVMLSGLAVQILAMTLLAQTKI
jgi:L-rhamnose-H+ transport protein